MQITTRNIRLEAANLAYEGSHAILYRAYTDQFGKAMYNFGILSMDGYWKDYLTGCGAWGPNGLQGLITSATKLNEQAKLTHEHKDDMAYLINATREKKITWNMVYDITGYYINEVTGDYVGPNDRGNVGR